MVIGPHGASARVMSFANGPPGLSSLPRRLLSTTSARMTTRPSSRPPNWNLWHPSNGVDFQQHQQQPLYPALDVTRFSTEASSATEDSQCKADTIKSLSVDDSTDSAQGSTWRRLRKWTQAYWRSSTQSDENDTKFSASDTTSPAMQDLSAGIDALAVGEEQQSTAKIVKDVPFTPLDFKMSPEAFRAAQDAGEGHPDSFWSHTLYRNTKEDSDSTKGMVQVNYCTNSETAEEAVKLFEGEKLLGLDLEWYPQAHKKSGVRKNVSLMQIASASHVVLLHLALYPGGDEFITPTLKKLLEDPEIRKTGVFISGDCSRIHTHLGVECKGKFELSHLYKQVIYSASGETHLINKKLVALAKLIQEVMGLPMKKDANVRSSDWSKPLKQTQLKYAASDAYAGVQLFAMLNHQREKLDPCPDLPFHVELCQPIPIPGGLEPPPLEVALGESDITDEKEIEAPDEFEKQASKPRRGTPVPKEKAVKKTKGKSAAKDTPKPPKHPLVEAAEAWLQEFRSSRKIKAAPAALRAYHIWHNNENITCKDLTRILSIKATTAASYVLSSLQTEKLPYDKARAKLLMANMPQKIAKNMFYGVWVALHSTQGIQFQSGVWREDKGDGGSE